MKIIIILFFLFGPISTTYLSAVAYAERTDSIPSPNIVLIVADDLGWSDLGCYGNPYFESPNLDRLAKQGVRFDNAYAACQVCSPTRASILTGRYPARIGLTNYLYGTKTVEDSPVLPAPFVRRLPPEEITIAEELKEDGYTTGLVGKWHLGSNPTSSVPDPKLQGFDVANSFEYGLMRVAGQYEWVKAKDSTQTYTLPNLTEEITQNAINFIRQNQDTAFFLMVTHYAVHLPLQGDSVLIKKYQNKNNPRPNDYYHVYGAMIDQMDQSVGRIVDALESNRLMNSTVVIFVSDNGGLAIAEAGPRPTVNDPLRAGKGTMYEGGIRVPMITYWKDHFEGGFINSSVVSTVDLYPTLLELVRGTSRVTHTIDGQTRLATFRTAQTMPRGATYWHYPHFSNQGGYPRAAVRLGDYKLIRSLENGDMELYNLREDIGEENDVSDQLPQKVAQLNDSLEHWFYETQANMPIPSAKRP